MLNRTNFHSYLQSILDKVEDQIHNKQKLNVEIKPLLELPTNKSYFRRPLQLIFPGNTETQSRNFGMSIFQHQISIITSNRFKNHLYYKRLIDIKHFNK